MQRTLSSRRQLLKWSLGSAGSLAILPHVAAQADGAVGASTPRSGPIGFTGFIHPSASIETAAFSIGPASLVEGLVHLEGARAHIGAATNLQDNDRLQNYTPAGGAHVPGDLEMGDGSFTAHGVTFIGRVRIGHACGTVINAVVQNARVSDASITGFLAQILGDNPGHLIEIPEASLVLFGARITSQADVAANTIPVPAPFSLFAADVDQENLLLARGYNLLYRAAARVTPFSAAEGDPRNPGSDFPTVAAAFGKLSVAPPTVDRRGTGVLPARQASLGDLGFGRFAPLMPVPTPGTPAPDNGGALQTAPPSGSAEAGARFIVPRVASPELVSDNAVVLGGCDLAAGVVVGAGSYLHGADAPTISVGAGTRIGQNTSLHELTFTSCRVGQNCRIGDRVVLHGPLEIGDNVSIGDGSVLFGPRVASGVRIGRDALVFGPLEITTDVPDRAIIVPQGSEGLVAPARRVASLSLAPHRGLSAEWRRAQDSGARCGCGAGLLLHLYA